MKESSTSYWSGLKGGAYYGGAAERPLKAFVQHLAQVEMLTRTKAYTNALKEIDGMLMKDHAVGKVVYLAECILSGAEVEKRPEQEKGLAAKRAAMVGEVRAWAERSIVRRPAGSPDGNGRGHPLMVMDPDFNGPPLDQEEPRPSGLRTRPKSRRPRSPIRTRSPTICARKV